MASAPEAKTKFRPGKFSWMRYTEPASLFDSEKDSSVVFLQPFEIDGIEATDQDIEYTVASTDRIDLLAYRFYGDPRLWWVIAYRNGMDLPAVQLYEGRKIIVPSPTMVRKDWAK